MPEKIIFYEDEPKTVKTNCEIIETYDFGECITSAAYVEFDEKHESKLQADEQIVGIEDNISATLRYEPDFISEEPTDVATIEDVRKLHNIPESAAPGEQQTITIMDSGIDTSHPVFEDTAVTQVDVTETGGSDDAVGHGTAVAGQVTRLAPAADLIALRIFGSEGKTKMNIILRAYEWLHKNHDRYNVVNMSWGAQKQSKQLDQIHSKLIEKGVRDVVAAGNSGAKSGSPATAKGAFSIGACTKDGKMAEFSSYNPNGDNPDVTAIGKDNRLAQASGTNMGKQLDGRWVKASGTSFASPEVAGMVAKYIDTKDDWSPKGVLESFESGARDIEDQPKDGAGIVDYQATVGKETADTSEQEVDKVL
ncbi:S8 family serine peptidase [Haladaptatus pallidirubidus]|uniref:Peptidase S8/S53 domain-containing protein n=1 Tax=Haladaptatus pallidirubidus TaxID=1008152 RepID=A0AAV3UNV1_9EURY|nr:S8 family serine peptidase [Haladaptatus pallidirubidus]